MRMLSDRKQFRLVTRDPRWCTLNVELVRDILDSDTLAISNETEIQGLVERWNSHADKSKDAITLLMGCCRETPDEDAKTPVKKPPHHSSKSKKHASAVNKKDESDEIIVFGGEGFMKLPAPVDTHRVRKPRVNNYGSIKVKK
jgi:hypothetical protein